MRRPLALALLLASAQALPVSQRPTVLDYWPSVKAKLTDYAVNHVDADIGHDYLDFTGDWDGAGQLAVWRYQGRDLVGVNVFGCGATCGTEELHFYDPQHGFKEVTAQVMPRLDKAAMLRALKRRSTDAAEPYPYIYNLPKDGTTIQIVGGDSPYGMTDTVLAKLLFDKQTGRFIFQAVR